MVSFESKPYSKRLLQLISWSHWFTFFNILAAILLSSIYIFSESMPDTLLGQTYLVTTWLSHMAFLTFMSFVLILFPITIISLEPALSGRRFNNFYRRVIAYYYSTLYLYPLGLSFKYFIQCTNT